MIAKRPVGRPQKFTKSELIDINEAFKTYIEETEDPTLPGFIVRHKWDLHKEYLSSRKEFSDSMKRLLAKQESFLLGMHKNPTMAIFRLKQPTFGYTDQRQVETKNLNVDVKVDNDMAANFLKYLKQSTNQDT